MDIIRIRRTPADDKPVGSTREASVGDEGAILAQARAHDGRRGREHLGHAGPTLGSLVADHDDGPLERVGILGQGVEHSLLGVVHLGETLEVQTLLAGDLSAGSFTRTPQSYRYTYNPPPPELTRPLSKPLVTTDVCTDVCTDV